MDGVDVESFIQNQRAKLAEEKARFPEMNRPAGGILPTDSIAVEKKKLLRQERQTEYLDYIKRREGRKEVISKIRSELSLDRENELAKNQANLASRKNADKSKSDYAAIRAKAFAQERQYTSDSMGYPEKLEDRHEGRLYRRKLEDTASQTQLDSATYPSRNSQPHQNVAGTNERAQRKAWDDEERDLMQWTRNKAGDRRHKVQSSQGVPEARLDPRKESSFDARPLPGWGKSYTDEQKEQKMKQKKYAEDLQEQMKGRGWTRTRDQAFADRQGRAENIHDSEQLKEENTGRNYGHTSNKGLKSAPSQPQAHVKAVDNRHGDSSAYNHSYYAGQYPPYPYLLPPPFPPGYQVPPGGPWAPPPFGYPHPHYRQDQDHEGHPQMYYQPYYFSPPRNRPSSRNFGPVPSVVYPYNMPARDDNPQKTPELYSRKERESFHNPAAPVKSRHSPPSSLQSSKEKSHHLGIGEGTTRVKNKAEYRRELEEQVREKKIRELEEKVAEERYEAKKSMDVYDPFGKGGCGAPVRDQHGNLVADLKQMRKINENRLSNNFVKARPGSSLRLGSKESNRPEVPSDSPDKSSQPTILTYSNQDNETVKKNAQESYRDYLRLQVQEKEKLKKEEKEKQRLEELKQLEQLERDRKKMQEEYQQELERQRKKEEDLRKKNEAIKLEAEKERQKVILRRQQEALKEEEERRKLAEQELDNRSPRGVLNQRAAWSPPVPTLRHQMKIGSHIPQSETFTEAPRLPLPLENPLRRSNNKVLENVSSSGTFIQGTPAFRHEPLRTDSPPVPALRNKISQNKALQEGSSSKGITEAGSSGNAARIYLSPRQGPPINSNVSNEPPVIPPRQPQLLRDRNEILTQLGDLRMKLQEAEAKQLRESTSEIFERVKQQKPGLAVPMRLKGSSTSVQTAVAKNARDRVLAAGSTVAFSHQTNSSNLARADNASITTNGVYREGPKDNSSDTMSLLSKKSSSSVKPWGNGVLAHPQPTRHLNKPAVEHPQRLLNRQRQGSPSTLSKYSINSTAIENMATRAEERMRRLNNILKSEAYGGEANLDGQSTDTMSLTLAHGTEEHQGRTRQHGHPRGLLPDSQRLHLPSRTSEQSLECETRHLPIQ